MEINSSKMLILFITSNAIWFGFTSYLMLDYYKSMKRSTKMISRLQESNEYLSGELNDIRDEFIGLKRRYDEVSIHIYKANVEVNDILKEMN